MIPRANLLLLSLCLLGLAPMDDLRKQAIQESLIPIRPGAPGKSPFWNAQAKQFIFDPAFDFKAIQGAAAYRFTLRSGDGKSRTFEAAEPWAPLTPVWAEIP